MSGSNGAGLALRAALASTRATLAALEWAEREREKQEQRLDVVDEDLHDVGDDDEEATGEYTAE